MPPRLLVASLVHPLRNILNRLRWSETEQADDYEITYRHRGAPGDVRKIRARTIERIAKSYFTMKTGNSVNSEEVVIPFHRVLEIRKLTDGSLIWVKKHLPTD